MAISGFYYPDLSNNKIHLQGTIRGSEINGLIDGYLTGVSERKWCL